MKYIFSITLLLFMIQLSAQYKADFVADSFGTEREILRVLNTNTTNLSAAALLVESGQSNTLTNGSLTSWATNYTGLAGYAGYTGVANGQNGILFRSFGSNGSIRFLTGGSAVPTFSRMFINSVGEVGIGTESPAEKLEVNNGRVYINGAGQGVVLKSPIGDCYEITVSSVGSLTTTPIVCPN